MSQNYPRSCSLSFSGTGGSLSIQGGGIDDLRIRFHIITHSLQAPNMSCIVISNLSDKTAGQIENEFQSVTLNAGYEDNSGIIFSGTIKQRIRDREEVTDKVLKVYCADGDIGYNFATINKTLAAGYTPQDVLDACIDALQPFGIPLGQVVGVDLSQPAAPRGITLSGAVKDTMRTLAANVKGFWSIQAGQLYLFSKDASRTDGPILINSNTGMVWLPRQTQSGIYVTTLINPHIQIRSQLQIDQKSIVRAEQDNNPLSQSSANTNSALDSQGLTDGVYTVIHQEIEGDTRGGPWYQYNTCIGSKTGVESKEQVGQEYGPGNDWLGPS